MKALLLVFSVAVRCTAAWGGVLLFIAVTAASVRGAHIHTEGMR